MEHNNSEQPLLTVVTPTYNRIKTIPYVYESLCTQTDKRFVWLIIDDGSSDNTRECVQRWSSENIIKIKYIYKENGGKASSLNVGLDNLDTPFCVCLDSDDKFYPNTVEVALEALEKVTEDN